MKTGTSQYEVETYRQTASNGHHIRMATKVIEIATGRTVQFVDRLPKREAIRQAKIYFTRLTN